MPCPAASVIVPTLNEQDHIGELLNTLLAEPGHVVGEVLVADGGSEDATRAIVAEAAARDARVRLIDNPDRIQAAGINRAVARSNHDHHTIVRADAHAVYPKGFVGKLLDAMARHRADSVVVRLKTVGATPIQRAIAAASNSIFGTGGAAHRVGRRSGWVDHGHHAAMRRSLFESVGGYDPTFEANEDAELDQRLRRAGGQIWFEADIAVGYVPRSSLGQLARQYFRYGSGRARTFLKHRERLRVRQLIPPIVLLAIGTALCLAPLTPWMLLVPGGYLAAVAAVGIATAVGSRSTAPLLMGPALATMHLAWGAGFLHRLAARGPAIMPAAAH